MKAIKILKTALRILAAVPCALGGVFHRRDDRSPYKRRLANRVGYCPVRCLSRNRHRSFCLDINTLIR